jgi:hypothetical protein
MGDENTKGITTVNGGSPKLGPGSNIHGEQCWPGPQGQPGKVDPDFDYTKLSKFRCVLVGNKQYDQLVDGNLYLVYRKHEQTGEPTYSLCTYENGCWIPYGIIESVKRLPWFTGVPVDDTDYWIGVNELFQNIDNPEEPEEPEKQNPEEESEKKETVQEYVQRRLDEIDKEETERARQAKEDEMKREMAGEFIPRGMPITPSPESQGIRALDRKFEVLMEFIQKMYDEIIDDPVIEKNWEHIKTLTNDMLDRISELEEKAKNQPFIPFPCIPVEPISPITPGYPNPNPSVPGYPFGPIITYSVPGQGPMCSFTSTPSVGFGVPGKK